MNIFYPIQMGYHLHNLVFHIFCRTHKATYVEMILHHYLTWFLIFYSYYTNYETFGITVLMCHDIGDFLMNIGKLVRDLQLVKGWKVDVFYLLIVVSWFYPRTIVASLTYIPNSLYAFFEQGSTIGPYTVPKNDWVHYNKYYAPRLQSTMLIALWILNAYWICLIIQIGMAKSKKGDYVAEWEGEEQKIDDKIVPEIKKAEQKVNGK